MRKPPIKILLLSLVAIVSPLALFSQALNSYHPEDYQVMSYDSLISHLNFDQDRVEAIFANDSNLLTYYEFYQIEQNKKGFAAYYHQQDQYAVKHEINWTEYGKEEYQRRYNGKKMHPLLQLGIASGITGLVGGTHPALLMPINTTGITK